MFKCQDCGAQMPAGQPENRIVVESRPCTYPPVTKNKSRRFFRPEGWEIVREDKVCPDCYERITQKPANKAVVPVSTKSTPRPRFPKKTTRGRKRPYQVEHLKKAPKRTINSPKQRSGNDNPKR